SFSIQICKGKIQAHDDYNKYSLTPDHDDEDWHDAVKEARGRGIPIAAFGDTKDKIVLHPGHLGYDFTYHWGRGDWTSEGCWDHNSHNKDTINKINDELREIGNKLINLGYVVWIAHISGSCKGYLSTNVYPLKEEERDDYANDVVLFVFGFNPSKHI